MVEYNNISELPGTALCKSCGLCCTGHLFIWVKLKPSELDPVEKLGVRVYRSDPTQRGFSQPCPLWQGCCTIYESPSYPRACRAYKCKLFKEILGDITSLPQALAVVQQAKDRIDALDPFLPASAGSGFRERLVAHIEHPPAGARADPTYAEFRSKADELLRFYETFFGVTDLLEQAGPHPTDSASSI